MTLVGGYALGPGEALEDLQMGGGSVLSLKVAGRQSNGLVTVIEGIALAGGPPLHLHEAEDEFVICPGNRTSGPWRRVSSPTSWSWTATR